MFGKVFNLKTILINYNSSKAIMRLMTSDHNNNSTKYVVKNKNRLPPLMSLCYIWPSWPLNALKNCISTFLIKNYFDNEFNIKEFVIGSKRALQIISSKLAKTEFDSLQIYLSQDVIKEIQPIIERLSVSQRQQLEISEADIYLSFPYQIGIIFDEKNEKLQRRWVEITMVFHVLRGLSELREQGEEIPWNMGSLPDYQQKVFICNYRFKKEFTIGKHSDWTVNALNHFKPIDLIIEK